MFTPRLTEYNTIENKALFFGTINFYINEKFIGCKKQIPGCLKGLRLTSKGFSVLNLKPPEKISSKMNFADALKEASETGKTEIIKNLVSQTIKFGFTYISS